MRSRFNSEHDFFGTQYTRDWVHATRNSLAQCNQIRLNICPLRAQHSSCATNSCLYLIADKKNIMLLAQFVDFRQIVVFWDNNTGLSLNWLNNERCSLLSMCLQCCLKVGD